MGELVKSEATAVTGLVVVGLEGTICIKAARVWTPGCSGAESGEAVEDKVGWRMDLVVVGVREGVGLREGLGCTLPLSRPRSLLRASFASMSCSLARAAGLGAAC